MSVTLKSSSGGSVTLLEPATASDFTQSLPAATGTFAVLDGSNNLSVAGNLSFNSGFGSAGVAYGCRAWVNFDGTGTPAIRASGNVSSITDNGTGDYTVNFTNAMPDANYGVSATSTLQAGVSNAGAIASLRNTGGTTPSQTTTGVRVITIGVDNTAEADVCQVNVSIFR